MTRQLAYRLRPTKLEDVIGQDHLIGEGKVLTLMVASQKPFSLILHGPPGTGKTSIASALAGSLDLPFHVFNAATDSKADLQKIAASAKTERLVLLLDEIHRLDKPKQDFLLPFLEDGSIVMIGATTENPYIAINPAIRSRASIYPLQAIETEQLARYLKDVAAREWPNKTLPDEGFTFIASRANGDVRRSLTVLEVAFESQAETQVSMQVVEAVLGQKSVEGDADGDAHYNLLSAFQKSIRGSDADASLHYLARLIQIGDLVSICRRLSIIAFEDIGLADTNAILLTKHAIATAFETGLPEARIPLSVAVIALALAPKSNLAYKSLDKALADTASLNTPIPDHLKDTHFKGAAKLGRTGYIYPHDYPYHHVNQQYLPDALLGTSYLDFSNANTAEETKLKHTYKALKGMHHER